MGVGGSDRPSSSESSSSPMVKAPPSSGTLLREGVLALWGLRMLSAEPFRDIRVGVVGLEASAASFLCCLRRSTSSWPLSSVNDLKASNRFLDL